MFSFLSFEVREGLERARQKASPRSRKLAVHLGEDVYPIRRIWSDGFAIEATNLSRLRGLVQIHEGSRHILNCLIHAADIQQDELICTYKRMSVVHDRPPVDYVIETDLPIALPRQ